MTEQILELLSKINAPELQSALLWLKIPFIGITVFFIAIIVLSVARTPYLQLSLAGDAAEFITYRPYGVPKMRRRWRRITRRLDRGTEAENKLAVIEADALLDEMLRKMNLKGETTDERLEKITPFMIPNLEELKTAHQARNSIVYDPDYRLNSADARRILEAYQRTFENLDLFR